ncbi:uncharacterized protein LOC132696458 isoform X1 [Cylas formicarius]|uniref:uncharacterized protein LOC132696458 isoform X1 n=1 Tax=Cylas formicarius TaxID=197179 RepID=UPI0029589F33|nr:uncharacterized protein LOC132696458 isoform X1 [Cylas formicarius]XP_060517257.1 uncharacterized protein LOC132696458 isoform X1 [Cylas formicarius]XP_060517258.1 uncharacterized protein LOC132696458 isoform X1 [Cylas formicarius]
MGMFWASLTVSGLNAAGIQIFRVPRVIGNGPLMSLYIFILSLFLLLWSVRIYPRNIRKLGRAQFFFEFLIAQFIMESLIIDFWFPLELNLLNLLFRLSEELEEMLAQGDWVCETLCDWLKGEAAGYLISYALSSSFLVASLHATRVIDMRTLRDGPTCFIRDITHKFKMNKRRLLRRLGLGGKMRVSFERSSTTCRCDNRNTSGKSFFSWRSNKSESLNSNDTSDRRYGSKNTSSVSRNRSRENSAEDVDLFNDYQNFENYSDDFSDDAYCIK